MEILMLREHREYIKKAAAWFHAKWGVPQAAYEESMLACLERNTAIPQWYQGIAGKLLQFVCDDMEEWNIHTLYLLTDHTSFYERYDWEFICMAKSEDGETMRIYQSPARLRSDVIG